MHPVPPPPPPIPLRLNGQSTPKLPNFAENGTRQSVIRRYFFAFTQHAYDTPFLRYLRRKFLMATVFMTGFCLSNSCRRVGWRLPQTGERTLCLHEPNQRSLCLHKPNQIISLQRAFRFFLFPELISSTDEIISKNRRIRAKEEITTAG